MAVKNIQLEEAPDNQTTGPGTTPESQRVDTREIVKESINDQTKGPGTTPTSPPNNPNVSGGNTGGEVVDPALKNNMANFTGTQSDRAEAEAQAHFDLQKNQAEQNALMARSEFESERQQLMNQYFGAEFASNQRINNFGWTGGSLTDENLRRHYLESSINASLFNQTELMRAGFDSELSVARKYAALKEIELANHYYDQAEMRALELSKITGYYVSPETQDMLMNYKSAQQILQGNPTDREREQAEAVMNSVRQWSVMMFGQDRVEDGLLDSFFNFYDAVRQYGQTLEGRLAEEAFARAETELEETPEEEPTFDPGDVADDDLITKDMINTMNLPDSIKEQLIDMVGDDFTKVAFEDTVRNLINDSTGETFVWALENNYLDTDRRWLNELGFNHFSELPEDIRNEMIKKIISENGGLDMINNLIEEYAANEIGLNFEKDDDDLDGQTTFEERVTEIVKQVQGEDTWDSNLRPDYIEFIKNSKDAEELRLRYSLLREFHDITITPERFEMFKEMGGTEDTFAQYLLRGLQLNQTSGSHQGFIQRNNGKDLYITKAGRFSRNQNRLPEIAIRIASEVFGLTAGERDGGVYVIEDVTLDDPIYQALIYAVHLYERQGVTSISALRENEFIQNYIKIPEDLTNTDEGESRW